MRFTFESFTDKTIITAIIEDDSEKYGYRAEGPYPKLELIQNKVTYNFPVQKTHPDLVALLCMLSFYPFCKDKVTFPFPVSQHFEKAFSDDILPLHEMIEGKYTRTKAIKIVNVDPHLEKYTGTEIAVSFGGGADSMAVHALYPDALVIHEQPILRNNTLQPDDTTKYMSYLASKNERAFNITSTSRHTLTQPSGWPTWTSAVSTSVLLAADYNIGYILTGTTLGSVFLQNGAKYFPATDPKRLNRWNRAFAAIGLKLFTPVGGTIEVNTTRICQDNNLLEYVVSCQSNAGNACKKCFKCFRKDTILNKLNHLKMDDVIMGRYMKNNIVEHLSRKPLYFNHEFRVTLPTLDSHYDLNRFITAIPDVAGWVDSYYPAALKLVPEELRDDCERRLQKYLKPMDAMSCELIEKWDVSKV